MPQSAGGESTVHVELVEPPPDGLQYAVVVHR
jgi:hypothetical protein